MAESYERRRPEYPDEVISWLTARLGLAPGTTVVDVGAGTGKLTRQLLPTGARIVAVEPLAEMHAQLEAAVPEAEALPGRAEALPLADGSVDAVVAASAIHWFDLDRALPEFHRVLRPGGALAAVSPSRDLSDPLQREIQAIVGRHLPPLRELRTFVAALEASPLFGPPEHLSTAFEQQFDPEGLAERVGTVSYVARLPQVEREDVLARVRALAETKPQPLAFRYRCDAWLWRRR